MRILLMLAVLFFVGTVYAGQNEPRSPETEEICALLAQANIVPKFCQTSTQPPDQGDARGRRN